MKHEIRSVAVVGSGTMGQGIAQASAMNGYDVILFDVNAKLVAKSIESIKASISSLVEKERITKDQAAAALARIKTVDILSDVKADLVIEAVIEDLIVKKDLFKKLESYNTENTILASNTSSLSINQIGEDLSKPERFAGLHFFNPATLMKLVEVIRGTHTSSDTVETLREFCVKLQKVPVFVKDSPGFIVNRVARLYYVEALRIVEEGASDISSIDSLMRNAGFKMGPFELMDLIGIDTNLMVTKSIYAAFNDPKFKPSAIQQKKVDEGNLGRKTGKGFYDYA